MKKTPAIAILLAASFALMSLISCKTPSASESGREKSIVVIYENDMHCNIEGYASIASLHDAVKDTAHAAIVSCGDYLQGGTAGAISHGQYVADVMRSVGYDAVTLGNHEFDYGTDRMFSLIKSAQLPVTCLNLLHYDTKRRPFSSYIMRTYGKRRVAYIGVVTPTTLNTESYAFYDKQGLQLYDITSKTLYKDVQNTVDEARKAGAHHVIVLAHLGESKNSYGADSHSLISATRGIDALLDGHTHSVVPCHYVKNADGISIPISQTGTKTAFVGKMVISPEGDITLGLVPDSLIKQTDNRTRCVIDSVNSIMHKRTEQVIGHSDFTLRILDNDGLQAVRYMETNAGDIVTDAYRTVMNADVAITNGGGIRTQLPAGPLTYGDIIALLPYDNNVCVVEVTGQQIVSVLEACCRATPIESGDFPQVSGMKFVINTAAKPRVADVSVYDPSTGTYLPISLDATYRLATIDYCISGGGLKNKLKSAKIVRDDKIRYCDVLATYIKDHLNGIIPSRYSQPQGRITIKRQ